jgi:heptosyltransferase-2/heptosyltransferase-3
MKRLLVNFARVGDMVMQVPMLRHLARSGRIDLLTRPWGRTLLAGQDWMGTVHALARPYKGHSFPSRLWYGGELADSARRLAAEHYDEVLMFNEFPRFARWVQGWAGKSVCQLDARALAKQVPHAVDLNRAALAAAGYDLDGYEDTPRLDVPPATLATAHARLAPLGRRVLAVQAGSSLTHRWWRKQPNLKGIPAERWAALIAGIINRGEADAAVLHGSAPEGREARAIRAALPPAQRANVHDWTGKAPLGELPGLFAAHSALLSVDTGPAHIAAAVGCPLLVLFGPSDPAKWLPRGPGRVVPLVGSAPCQFCMDTPLFKTCRRNICLTALDDAALEAGWRRVLAGT